MADWVLEIRGMTCGHCVKSVTEALEAVDGVTGAAVTLEPPRAEISGAEVKRGALLAAVSGAGFTAIVPTG